MLHPLLPCTGSMSDASAECSACAELAFSLLEDHRRVNDNLTLQQAALEESQRQVREAEYAPPKQGFALSVN